MRIYPLLRNVRHRAAITSVGPRRTRLNRINAIYWTVYRSFEIILEWELSTGMEFKSNVCATKMHRKVCTPGIIQKLLCKQK